MSTFAPGTFSQKAAKSNLETEYDSLSPEGKAIVDKHLRRAGQLHMWEDINSYLIEQMHHKKATKKGERYRLSDPLTDKYYSYYLFHGKKQLGGLSGYPSEFKCEFDSKVCSELSRAGESQFNFPAIYYNHRDKPPHLRFDNFNEADWQLSSQPDMTPSDIAVMHKYRQQFLAFLDDCLHELNINNRDKGTGVGKKCYKTRQDVEKAMNKVN